MAVHKVTMNLPRNIVVNSDVELEIYSNGKKLGELHVSKGSIDWRPNRTKKTEYRLEWEDFALLMEGTKPTKVP
jgi:hypothetical protein